uniref:Core-binding (CB) domain-containing protein n=1 Tax=Pelodiscus sinensis TaxID=13735 RepID=K7EYP5_PELSI
MSSYKGAPVTRKTYLSKWTQFVHWATSRNIRPQDAPFPDVLEYLLHLRQSHLSLSSIRVHLAAIATFHATVEDTTVFAHPVTKQFLKGLQALYPEVALPQESWELHLVLTTLTKPPFEPMATCSLYHLSLKTAFLVAIISARRVSEMAALMAEPPFTIFFKNKVTMRPHPKFLGMDFCGWRPGGWGPGGRGLAMEFWS